MTIKDLMRPIPGVRRLSLVHQRLGFVDSAHYWESNYMRGWTSGEGSYGELGRSKAEFLNAFVREHAVGSVTEFGCGDGHQLSLAEYPRYLGLAVSRTAIGLCKGRFAADTTKSFFLYDGECFVDRVGLFAADLAISLDVVYHLIEDRVFETYMEHLFGAGQRYVVVYSTNMVMHGTAPHVRHRHFSSWVEDNRPDWQLIQSEPGPSEARFFVYERLTAAAL